MNRKKQDIKKPMLSDSESMGSLTIRAGLVKSLPFCYAKA